MLDTYKSCESNCKICNKRIWLSPEQYNDPKEHICDTCDDAMADNKFYDYLDSQQD